MLASIAWGADVLSRELLLFTLFWFILAALDELWIDLVWAGLRLAGRARTPRLREPPASRLSGRIAVFIPAWCESDVLGTTIAYLLRAWPQPEMRLYIGCYRNDSPTLATAMAAAGADPRVRLVVTDRAGPTTKADCLNRLDEALRADEARLGERFRAVVFHDAEDMVHPQALPAIDRALAGCDFVQLPVRPEPAPGAHWVSGHYCDEFAESHAEVMVVRDALGAALPVAGVGCGLARDMLDRLAARRRARGKSGGPFAAEALTEDYELGLLVARLGGRGRFLRLRDRDGTLVATRSLFPDELGPAVRQKSRWIHGIALQGWDRLGWAPRAVDVWMALRDRRGPMAALVIAGGYLLLVVNLVRLLLHAAIDLPAPPQAGVLAGMLAFGMANLVWRGTLRAAFTAREYGWDEGLRALLRIPVGNVILILSGRRALSAYLLSLAGVPVRWDKTAHRQHVAGLARDGIVPDGAPAAVPAAATA
ncbi:MAG: glycosyl transferase family protein [Sphingomonadales bacterium]|nr:glycosyl transferase family protein [Sphingomonadales bacterium]